ncbi:MAG: hypothetical protein EPO23_03320 [Xanthobacteraceae bacterium]|nr:MAG: hypothetical protein EPO23_03320 [Xanthobacteraceae bacterium]
MPGNGFTLNISADIDGLASRLDAFQRDSVPFWTSKALNDTANDIKDAEVAEMARVFDRPTRFTLNALYVKFSSKSNLTAAVLFKDGGASIPAWRYLGPEVEGGSRRQKSYERRLVQFGAMRQDEVAVPAQGIKVDQYGNIPGSTWQIIMADLGYMRDPNQNSTARSRTGRKGKARGRYMVLRPDAALGHPNLVRNVPPGIYWRQSGSRAIVPVIAFVRAANYKPRLPFYDIAKRVMQQRFAENFRKAMAQYPARYR